MTHSRYILIDHWLNLQFNGGNKKKWTTFTHNGVMFPPEYVQHKIPILYKGSPVQLEPLAEEFATLYSKYIDTEYINNKIFRKNFWDDWKKILGKDNIIQSLEDCDFTPIHNFLVKDREAKLNISKDEKDKQKKEREDQEKPFKTAIVDGKEQPVGNFRVEPPGIFIGRGFHPKLGKIKNRTYPEDITINIGKDAKIPDTITGHKWGHIIHENTVEWLASWKDHISGKIKYVWLGSQSDFKAQSDIHKFDKARKLKRKIKSIREQNEINLKSTDLKTRQIATALYFIDKLALRVGNEKGDDEADTVGVTSLRVEHIEFNDDEIARLNEVIVREVDDDDIVDETESDIESESPTKIYKITLDFLGKDSIRYKNTVMVDEQVYKNLKEFTTGKSKNDELFDLMNSADINKYLQSFMKDLTAKVFRTYNASNLFQKELTKISNKFTSYEKDDKIKLLLDNFNKANAKVATLCNHQKNISKSFTEQLDKMNNTIKTAKSKLRKAKTSKGENKNEKIEKLKDKLNQLKTKKELKIELKNVSLGTSKVNYLDPRITIAFMKKHNLPVDSVFSKTLQDKFKWAFDVDENYKF